MIRLFGMKRICLSDQEFEKANLISTSRRKMASGIWLGKSFAFDHAVKIAKIQAGYFDSIFHKKN